MKNYDFKCDIWSAGVIFYTMINGRPPFNADNDLEIMRMIKIGKYNMFSRIWDQVSIEAKDLLKGMLCYEPDKRMTAQQCLQHPWFMVDMVEDLGAKYQRQNNLHENHHHHGHQHTHQKKDRESMYQLTNQEIQNALANMKTFKVTQKLKQATYAYIVTHLLTKAEKKPLAKLFTELNRESDGCLSKLDICNAFEKYFGNPIDEEDVDKIFKQIDVNGGGAIEYSEFMLACIPEKVLLTNENMAVVFKVFDEDGSGSISKEEIQKVFSCQNKKISKRVAKQILMEID